MTYKKCKECRVNKPLTDFRLWHGLKTYNSKCKICCDKICEDARLVNKEKRKNQDRARNLMNKFGITLEQYNIVLKKQKNKCAICDRHEKEFKTRLCVDHNHITGEIRGLLCTYCNHRVIGRHRNGDLLRKMADYVDGGTGWFVPKKKKTVKRKPKHHG